MAYICGLCDKAITEIVNPSNPCECEKPFVYNNFKGAPERAKKALWAIEARREKWGKLVDFEHSRRQGFNVLCDHDCSDCARKRNDVAPRRSERLLKLKRTLQDFRQEAVAIRDEVHDIFVSQNSKGSKVALEEAFDNLMYEIDEFAHENS